MISIPQQTSGNDAVPGREGAAGPQRGNVDSSSRSAITENGRGGQEGGRGGGQEGGRGGGNLAGDTDDSRRNLQPMYPDNQQVFVGNVPHTITDADLKEYFERKCMILL